MCREQILRKLLLIGMFCGFGAQEGWMTSAAHSAKVKNRGTVAEAIESLKIQLESAKTQTKKEEACKTRILNQDSCNQCNCIIVTYYDQEGKADPQCVVKAKEICKQSGVDVNKLLSKGSKKRD